MPLLSVLSLLAKKILAQCISSPSRILVKIQYTVNTGMELDQNKSLASELSFDRDEQ